MEIVENQKGYNYSAQYVKNNPYHDAFYADVNPGYGTYTKTVTLTMLSIIPLVSKG